MTIHYTDLFSTYSIVARDPDTGQLGVAVETHQMSVGKTVPWLLPGVGALATQSLANISFGPMGLAMLREGLPAPRVIEGLISSDDRADQRQVAAVDVQGRVGAWTGKRCIAVAGHHIGEGYSVQANIMVTDTVIPAMAKAYESTSGDIAARMMAALIAAQAEGGDLRGMQSAAIKVVPGDVTVHQWTTDYDLRVDEHQNPVEELARLVRLRSAHRLDASAHEALERGQREEALAMWAQVRAQAPELEELVFWQAITFANKHADVQTAAAILRPMLAHDPNRAHWLDLVQRLQASGFIEREGAAQELLAALG